MIKTTFSSPPSSLLLFPPRRRLAGNFPTVSLSSPAFRLIPLSVYIYIVILPFVPFLLLLEFVLFSESLWWSRRSVVTMSVSEAAIHGSSVGSMAVKPPSHPTYDIKTVIKLALAEDAGDRGVFLLLWSNSSLVIKIPIGAVLSLCCNWWLLSRTMKL